jgi:serine/threonine protein kinase
VQSARFVVHPNLIKIQDMGVAADGQLYLVMPYCDGDRLSKRNMDQSASSQKGKIPVAESLFIVRQLARILDVAHESGVIHRNLTADSVIVREDGVAYLMGIDMPALVGRLPGTVAMQKYLSSEQLLGKIPDGRSNVYSLGVILFELLSGNPVGRKVVVETDADALAELSPQTVAVVTECLQESAWARFQSMQELIIALDQAITAETSDDDSLLVADLFQAGSAAALPAGYSKPPGYSTETPLWRRPIVIAPILLLVVLLAFFIMRTDSSRLPWLTVNENEDEQPIRLFPTVQEDPSMVEEIEETATPTRPLSVRLTAQVIMGPDRPGSQATPTFIPTSTYTPTPTDTPTPTPTPTNTPTPTPTPTYTPTPRPPTSTPTSTPVPPTATPVPPPPKPPSKPPPPPPPTATPP